MNKAIGLATALIIASTAMGCAGKTARERYLEQAHEATQRYDALYVQNTVKPLGPSARSCESFIDKLKDRYKGWKPGEAGARFCAQNPDAQARVSFELNVRNRHNQHVTAAKAKRLAAIRKSYESETMAEGLERRPQAKPRVHADSARAPRLAAPAAASRRGLLNQDPNGALSAAAKPSSHRPAHIRPSEPAALGKPGEQLPYGFDDEAPPAAPTLPKVTPRAPSLNSEYEAIPLESSMTSEYQD